MAPPTEQDDGRRLKALFEMATDGIITMNGRGVIENANKAAADLFGYTVAEMLGQKVNMLMGDHDRVHHDAYLQRYQRTREPHIIGIGREVIGRCKSGREFPLRLAVSEVKLDNGVLYTGILHDLTEYHKAQDRVNELNRELENKVQDRTAALRAREVELKRALGRERELNELKSRFLSMASHEFKTPLSTVLSSAEIIELYQEAEQQPKRLRHLDRIKSAVSQLTEVLDDFLSLSQLDQGEVTVNEHSIDVRALLATSIETSEGQLRPGQRVEMVVEETVRTVYTDAKLLRHVLMNLISNAAKYSPEGAPIVVRAEAARDRILISVEDRGIGIPEADRPHLFDRFFRAGNVENIKGTGLGLNIVRHYVELLSGSIDFRSELGRGTTFTVSLSNQPNHG
ncbi:PAS/PAC sensor signal transduction histidine kinase [Neolewinella xylanilytica]|uniref:Sensor protein FixL n=1 Tax=Neolewinella xylanilytica TaxID=1514080 RepID=A0A2S6I7Y7_9BACT|nr:PAS domain-containing sensor histidine kinase [Neolewinella xylanilytica]PPK87617.1 PAS/PAC sensor signal transduction histidine kinase [Neolewinella xylanilytica]